MESHGSESWEKYARISGNTESTAENDSNTGEKMTDYEKRKIALKNAEELEYFEAYDTKRKIDCLARLNRI